VGIDCFRKAARAVKTLLHLTGFRNDPMRNVGAVSALAIVDAVWL
jgi:hypothetical protein